MRKLTVGFDECDQAFPGRADYLQAAPYLLVDILVEGKQGVAQGGDRVTEFMISWVKTRVSRIHDRSPYRPARC